MTTKLLSFWMQPLFVWRHYATLQKLFSHINRIDHDTGHRYLETSVHCYRTARRNISVTLGFQFQLLCTIKGFYVDIASIMHRYYIDITRK